MRIAVIGSGIAGLSATWALGRAHEVVLYEAHASLGMDAFSIDVSRGEGSVRVDVPMRVLFDGFYPTLTALYRAAGIGTEPLEYSSSFSDLGGPLHFRYRNYRLGGLSLPFIEPSALLRPRRVKAGISVARGLLAIREEERARAELDRMTLGDYLRAPAFDAFFRERFLLPAYAGVCTCSYETLLTYPAGIIVDYLRSGVLRQSMRRVSSGVRNAVRRLGEAAAEVRLNAPVQAIDVEDDAVVVRSGRGDTDRFDHVVVATEANRALELLAAPTEAERAALSAVGYESFDVVVHTDARLAPRRRSWWSPVNFVLEPGSAAPMATILLGDLDGTDGAPPVFQTWNPLRDPAPERVLTRAVQHRPVVSIGSNAALGALDRLGDEPDRRIWFCGSYAARGIPLQEGATSSAFAVAGRLGLDPWRRVGLAAPV